MGFKLLGIKERKERNFQKREAEILEAGKKVFYKFGIFSSTMEMISNEMEIGRTTLYLHFKSKDEIMAKILTEWYKKLRLKIENICPNRNSLEKMKLVIREYLEHCLSHPDEYFISRVIESSVKKENISRKILKELEEERKKRIELMENIYNEARNEGLIEDHHIYFLVGTGWGMLRGVVDVIIENHFVKEITEKEKFFQFVEKVFFHGILLKENHNETIGKKNSKQAFK
ncbi:MAG: TetR/AcrR family transcriptional regulator [Leptospiraceae bacterium]|nr:TetR/AcrR family transcriptional regulator [Leptospiraceae bacterium]MCK6382060.1 TetR/AcrR family transcriptional regulator [Leptospiraceae bacterium]NUM41018.1 TetR/AcrR family transcriptional regulator [Leptospiraceae bacterium]